LAQTCFEVIKLQIRFAGRDFMIFRIEHLQHARRELWENSGSIHILFEYFSKPKQIRAGGEFVMNHAFIILHSEFFFISASP